MIINTVKRSQAKRKKEHQDRYGTGSEIRKLDEYTPESIAEQLKARVKLVPFIALQD